MGGLLLEQLSFGVPIHVNLLGLFNILEWACMSISPVKRIRRLPGLVLTVSFLGTCVSNPNNTHLL